MRQNGFFDSKGFSMHFLNKHLFINKSKKSILLVIYITNSFEFNLIKSVRNNKIPSLKYSFFLIINSVSFSEFKTAEKKLLRGLRK